jgi:tryptophan synthase alpha subunit
MSVLHAAVEKASDDGKVALMIYTIPNFPNPETYKETLDILYQHPNVTFIETTFPVSSKYSKFANKTIRSAHQQAIEYVDGLTVLENLQAFNKPSTCVLYQETFDALGFESILKKMQGKIDSILFEWEVDEMSSYASLAEQYEIELIQCAYPGMTPTEMDKYIGLTGKKPLIYLVSAAMTGADLCSDAELIECIRKTKKYRPEAKMMAGFGIRNADDIRNMSRLEGLDGVIIGTAFLETMSQGVKAVEEFLDSIAPALNKVQH